MALLSLSDVRLTFAGPPLLDSVSLQSDVVRQPRLRVASLRQEVPPDLAGPVRAYLNVASGAPASEQSWQIETRIEQVAHDLTIDLDATIASLSAGSKRRVLLAAALVRDPDVL